MFAKSVSKTCGKCKETKPLTEFHKMGIRGTHTWCKACYNARAREIKNPKNTAGQRRKWQLFTRYRLQEQDLEAMKIAQGVVCAICKKEMKRVCVDHCHTTKKVRGLLCHHCNIRLATIEDKAYREAAMIYLSAT